MTALDAIVAALQPLGYAVHLDYNSGDVVPPYIVVGGPGEGRPEEEGLAGAPDAGSDLRVTAVFGTSEGVRIGLERVLGILSPGKDWTTVASGVNTRFVRREVVDFDTSVTVTGSGRHPAYGVDTYRLVQEI